MFFLVFLVEMALSGKKSNKLGEWREEKSKNVWNEDCDYCWLMFDRTFDNDHWWWMNEELWMMVIHGDWWLVIDGDWWMNGWMDDGSCMMQASWCMMKMKQWIWMFLCCLRKCIISRKYKENMTNHRFVGYCECALDCTLSNKAEQ